MIALFRALPIFLIASCATKISPSDCVERFEVLRKARLHRGEAWPSAEMSGQYLANGQPQKVRDLPRLCALTFERGAPEKTAGGGEDFILGFGTDTLKRSSPRKVILLAPVVIESCEGDEFRLRSLISEKAVAVLSVRPQSVTLKARWTPDGDHECRDLNL